jgi:hypothetical protein
LQKVVEQEIRVGWTAFRFWMKLHREPRLGGVNDAFIGSIVGIDLGYKSCGRFVQERKNEICRLMNNLKKLNRTFHLSQ